MRKRVVDLARELNFEPNIMAANLRSGHSKLIGMIVPYQDTAFFSSVIRGVEDEILQHGYQVIVAQSNEQLAKEIKALEALSATQVAGVLLSLSRETDQFDHINALKDKQKPIVLFDRSSFQIDCDKVVLDDFQAAFDAVSHLISSGCSNIAILHGPLHLDLYAERMRGFLTALKAASVAHNEDLMVCVDDTTESGADAAARLMKSPNPPDAFFTTSDYMALGVMSYLNTLNVDVPDEVKVVGFSNEPFTRWLVPSLTTIDQQSQEMGRVAARLLVQRIEGHGVAVAQKVVISPKLVIRDSSTSRESIGRESLV
ncbi:LacI family transcriptional regulator [Marinoscillum furvescens DSM 4134]|uniref:LacI family transcriptional regulator n=2 Tax=Marinoscillum furvescens TaxID=1026 RepID=A0A3D9LGM2_MARFU|nr:LacI family transcriptional regulator [Marinoscillum furvescens DSM 4134]